MNLALAGKGVFVTVVDLSEEKGKEVAALVEKENAKFYSNLGFPSATFIRCDVANTSKFAYIYLFVDTGLSSFCTFSLFIVHSWHWLF